MGLSRRDLIRVCAIGGTLGLTKNVGIPFPVQGSPLRKFPRVPLMFANGKPVKPQSLKVEVPYVFFYPYRSTPCFLIKLRERVGPVSLRLESGDIYKWQGGIGKEKTVVAFVAICTHQLSYPRRDKSFLSYYPKEKKSPLTGKDEVIQCCAHMSAFDPKSGAKPVEGPAKDPLPAVILHEDTNGIYAEGVLGKDIFGEFFDLYRRELRREFGSSKKAKELVSQATVVELSDFTGNIIKC